MGSCQKQFAEVERALSMPLDLTDEVIFMRVKVMPGFSPDPRYPAFLNFFIKTGGDYVFTSSMANVEDYGDWVEYVLDPNEASTYGDIPADLTQVVAIGLQLHTNTAEGDAELPSSATLYLDTVGHRPANASGTVQCCAPTEDSSENDVVLEPLSGAKPVRGDRWRGFNLIGMYARQWPETNQGFKEQAFVAMSDLGFNYARLPLDYRTYTTESDWLSFDPDTIGGLDAAIEWAQKYGVHAALCLHRAPGYCVHDHAGRIVDVPADQDLDLWKDGAAQDAFIEHWKMLARRYSKIAPEHLSFNLVNEPWEVDEATYVDLMTRTIEAIREISPDRAIVVDGMNTANDPIEDPDFLELENVVQSKHAYDFQKFQWYDTPYNPGSESWPVPHWPPTMLAGFLYGPWQESYVATDPLVIEGTFPAGTTVRLRVNSVNIGARLVIRSNRETLVDELLVPSSGDSSWTPLGVFDGVEYYEKRYDSDFGGTLTVDATELVFEVTERNMLDFTALTLQIRDEHGGDETLTWIPLFAWGVPQAHFRLSETELELVSFPEEATEYYDLDHYLEPWKALAAKGVAVVIGEFNQTNKTPYEDAYRFNEFMLSTFEEANFGWAFWDFDSTNPAAGGAFINNERAGATYEDYQGYEIDRNMCELFQSH